MFESYLQLFARRHQLLVCVVAVILVADFIMFGYLPSHNRIASLKQAKAEQARVISGAAAQGKELPAAEAQLQKLRAKVGKYQAGVPTERAIGAFLKEIANIMTERDLTEQLVAPGTETKTDGLGCIPVHIKCKGKLAQMFQFFQQLQASDRLIRIEKVKLTNDPDSTGLLTMETEAVIFYRSQAERS